MALFKTCCCCSLRIGTLLIGWCEAVAGVIGMILALIMVYILLCLKVDVPGHIKDNPSTTSHNSTENDPQKIKHNDIVLGKSVYACMLLIMIGIFLYYLCFTILAMFLIVGVHKQNIRYIRLWIQIKTIVLLMALLGISLQMFLMLYDVSTSVGDQIIVSAVDGIMILMVHSYYDEVIENSVPTYY